MDQLPKAKPSRPTVPKPPPELDLRSLDLEAPAAVLRRWALSLVEEVAGEAMEDARDPERLEALGPVLRTGRRRPGDRSWTLRPLRSGRRAELRSSISWRIAGHLRRTSRRGGWWRWRAFAGRPVVPAGSWRLIAEMAWRDPGFERAVAGALCEHLRRRHLVLDGRLPSPVIGPQAWWLLLDLVALPDFRRGPDPRPWSLARLVPRFLRLLWYDRGRRRRLRRRLSTIAQWQFLETGGWAGLWEQWLIGEVMLRRSDAMRGASRRARQVLGLLPYLETPRYAEIHGMLRLRLRSKKQANQERRRLVDPAWEEHRPTWLEWNVDALAGSSESADG